MKKLYLLLILPLIGGLSSCNNIDKKEKETDAIHDRILTIDTHTDTPLELVRNAFDLGAEHKAPDSRVDIPRMEKGGLDAIFFAVFTGQKPRTAENYQKAYERAHQMIDSIDVAIERNHDKIELALQSADAEKIVQKGKKAIYLGMENGFPVGTDINRVKEFYDRGIRYITLAHTDNNDICDSSTDKDGPEHNGLSDFGKKVIEEMNNTGMLVDVSHISDKAFYDVLEHSKVPVFASHSSVRAICDHPRNLDDEMIKALAEKDGVIQICIFAYYITEEDTTAMNYVKRQEFRQKYPNRDSLSKEERNKLRAEWRQIYKDYPPILPTVSDAVDHIDHVVKLVGIDHVGIGTDFDGGGGLADCKDVAELPNITRELVKRGYTEEEIAKIWGGNFMRVFKAAEEYAKNLE